MPKQNPSTIAARIGIESDAHHGAVIPPLHLSSTFAFEGFKQKRKYDYTRSGNPTRDLTAEAIASLEEGFGAVITSTGMSAITLVINLLEKDDLVIACHDCYGGTYRLLNHLRQRGFIRCEFVDFSNPIALKDALAQDPKLCWVETPSNPLLRIVNIAEISKQKSADTLLVVDNTFLTPFGQKPFHLGADIVVHSTTKYINGHSDVVGGAVVAKTADILEKLAWTANCLGITGSPFDSFLTLRGIRTLPLRFKQHCKNAVEIAEFLDGHPAVKTVYYPGLKSHPQYNLARIQQTEFGAMISFELMDDIQVEEFLKPLKLFSLAESLGGVESLIAHPASMTHAAMDETARLTAGITDKLLRLSVGIEGVEDLIADLELALNQASRSGAWVGAAKEKNVSIGQ